jgi:hypothetical protein
VTNITQATARQLLAAENRGADVITRESDGVVFIQQSVAERVIKRLLIQKAYNT